MLKLLIVLLLLPGCVPGMHWCTDETKMLFMSIPFIGIGVAWLRAKIHHWRKHKNCKGAQ